MTAPLRAPASYAQERAWFAASLAHDPSTYCVVDEFTVHAEIDARDLTSALLLLTERHEPLRTGLRVDDGTLTQYVHPRVTLPVEVVDVRDLAAPAQAARRHTMRVELARRPFDPECPPLWRAALMEFGDGAWSVLFAAHHTVYDLASRFNLHAELTEVCAAAEEGRRPELPRLPCSYTEHARRERSLLTAGRRDDLTAHWRTELAGLPPVHTLPLDRPRRPARTFSGAEVRAELPPEVATALADGARELGLRPVVLLLAAYVILLHHRSGAPDVVVGVPVAGRAGAEMSSMVGAFVNMRLLRVDMTGEPDALRIVRRVQDGLRAAERHDIPFQILVELLPAARLPGVPPLYQLAFNHCPAGELGAEVTSCEEDLLLDVAGGAVRLVYDLALFDRATMDILLSDYLRVLAATLRDPYRPVSLLCHSLGPARRSPGPGPDDRGPAVAPSTPAERRVAAAWSELLGVRVTDVHQDFFALGGHSVQALRLLAALSRGPHTGDLHAAGLLRAFFADPTVAGLATALPHTSEGGQG